MLQGEHSAIFSTFIKLLHVYAIKISVLSMFDRPFYTGFTVYMLTGLLWQTVADNRTTRVHFTLRSPS